MSHKITLLPALIVFCLPAISEAAETFEVWAPGVSRTSGWVDFNKNCTDSSNPMADMGMCWAATASNVITWWQTQNKSKLSSENMPTETYGISSNWDIFRTVYKDVGGVPSAAYEWFINGVSKDQYDQPIFPATMDFTLEYSKESATGYASTLWEGGFLKNLGVETTGFTVGPDSFDDIVNALKNGYALSVSTSPRDGSSAHAVTLWGITYSGTIDDPDNTYLWITDSDNVGGQDGLIQTSFKISSDGLSIEYGGLILSRVDGMRTIVIPEPSAFGLFAGIFALGLLSLRRRRRNCSHQMI